MVKKVAARVAPQEKVARFEGDPTSPAAAKAQRTHNTAMDAALNSSEEGPSPKNLPPATNRRGNQKPETPGGKPTDPMNQRRAGKLTLGQIITGIQKIRGKS